MKKLVLYFHTIKYLKFTQLYHRVLKRFTHPKINLIQGERCDISGQWQVKELCAQKFINETDVKFLNHVGSVENIGDWNKATKEKLWLYNLHYFDDLNSFGSQSRHELQRHWINKWIDENAPDSVGNGWEPYPISLRLVNWVKAFLSGLSPSNKMLDSLAQQADFLSQDLEKHLLGNHYFVNLKALIFAGCFLEGTEASKWLAIGLKDFERELNEQVLDDGGSFELTPMYHAIMLTDLLDLYNLFQAFPDRIPYSTIEITKNKIIKMLKWLELMSHSDGSISFFNDASFGIAPSNDILREYAYKLGFVSVLEKIKYSPNELSVFDLESTGYVSVKSAELDLIADLAEVGPSYIPGHAHADSLSFEMSLGGRRIFVNSGSSLYGASNERLRQRGTSAHNTVEVNGKNSSEVWSGFRVARRASIRNRVVGQVSSEQKVQFSAEHNGYKKQGMSCIHYRSWEVLLSSCTINDEIIGDFNSAFGYLHLHPEVVIARISVDKCTLSVDGYEIQLEIEGAQLNAEESTWHPEFGIVKPSQKLCLKYSQSRVTYKINWKKL